jgi:hypothetical protein
VDAITVDTTPKRLTARTAAHGTHTGFSVWGAVLFGAPVVAIGALTTAFGVGYFQIDPGGLHQPLWVLAAFGGVFLLAGLAVWGSALRQHRAAARVAAARAEFVGRPEMADFAWDPTGADAPRWGPALKGVATAAFLTLFLSVFNWWAFWSDEGHWIVTAITALFDVLALLVWWEALRRVLHALKFGAARLEYTRFPYRVGEPVELRWQVPRAISQAQAGRFTLRCIAEWWEEVDSGRERSRRVVHEARWQACWSFDSSRALDSGLPLNLRFEPPAGLPATTLSAEQPFFWELEVEIDVPGLDYRTAYLVPVY